MPPKAAAAKPAAKAVPKAVPKPEAKKAPKPAKKEVTEEEAEARVPQPDKDAFTEAERKISEAIDGLTAEAKKYTDEINSRSGGKDEFNTKRNEIRAKLDEFSKKIDTLMARKGEIQKAMGDKRQESMDMRTELNKMKKNIGYTNEVEIDERIAEIEKKMVTETVSLKEEKDLIKEISDLKKRRPQVAKVKAMEGNLSTRDIGGDLKEQIGIINAEMAQYRDGKRLVQEELKALMDGRSSQVGDLSDIFAKREAVNNKVKVKIVERNELRDKFRQEERDYNQYLRQVREQRAAKAAEERNAKQAEYQKAKLIRAAEKLDEQPHVSEMALIEQCMNFCKSLVATKESEVKEEKKEIEHKLDKGMEILTKKEDREEFYFIPTAKKKSKETKAKGSKAEGAKAIKHNAATFRLFDSLKLNAPITTEDIPATLEELDTLLDSYKAKVKEWEEKRDDMKRKILEQGILPDEEEEKDKKDAAAEPAAEAEAES